MFFFYVFFGIYFSFIIVNGKRQMKLFVSGGVPINSDNNSILRIEDLKTNGQGIASVIA